MPTESELCTQFGVSRTAVREALQSLSAKGLITIIKGKGIFIKESMLDIVTDPMHLYLQLHLERGYVLDIVRARQIIEPSIASFAAIHHTKDDIEQLHQDIEEMRKCEDGFVQLARLDMQFHLDIARASRNSIMPLILNPIHRLLPEIKSSVYATNTDAKTSAMEWHQKIFDCIARRDPDGAAGAMTEHLRIAEQHAEKMLKAQKHTSRELIGNG